MTALGDELDAAAVSELLRLASAVAGDEPIAVVDAEGRVVAGRSPGERPTRRRSMRLEGRTLGAIVSTTRVRPELLDLVARSLELVVADAEQRSAQARMTEELAIGRRIQLALVPRRFPELAGWAFAAAYEPAREVGGDLFDAFVLRGQAGRVGLLIADVTGKGIPAALMMADVRALIHAATDNAPGPADALARVNRILVQERASALLVTAALLVLDTATGALRYTSAGHEPPLVARAAGGVDALVAGGTILGLVAEAECAEHRAALRPGDALVLYTDGITDARDRNGRFYGEERLRAAIRAGCGRPAEAIVRLITDDVRAFRGDVDPFDDLTLLVIERRRDA